MRDGMIFPSVVLQVRRQPRAQSNYPSTLQRSAQALAEGPALCACQRFRRAHANREPARIQAYL